MLSKYLLFEGRGHDGWGSARDKKNGPNGI